MKALSFLDRLLRGDLTREADLRAGRIDAPVGLLLATALVLGAVYGVFMGLYGALRPVSPSLAQLLMSSVKVPLLFLLTLVVTLPSLYVTSALAGSRLRFTQTLRLLLIGIVVDLALLASFGPVTGFFTLSTDSYPFMVCLNVLFFTASGLVGLAVMSRAVAAMVEPATRFRDGAGGAGEVPVLDPADADSPRTMPAAAVEPPPTRARLIFWTWMLIYSAVGAQMGWILRPFIGAPGIPVSIFRERRSNFFEAILQAFAELFR